ncbi:rhomboid family intramembrane serine protease [Trichlorobacter lovleyi]|uniref:rhomboid family intramembrane serine protease n=1 Tax=Trichlorobacter lovleyi TaxID=313985 RepID=UPI00223FA0F9|nr:rhomboid family intramembrane serine protease [Trichlorobacter lovleyi]QOX79360.1 rhomboid family intramembrane serine protease [Trichlorobacter lovleyi]
MTQRAILCPRCRRLIGSDETVCSWCGTSRSSAWWQLIHWTRGGMEGDWTVKALISINIVYFALSLLLSISNGAAGGLLSPGQDSLLLLGATGTYPIDHSGSYWTLLSANYLHGGILHLLFNLMALRQLAPRVINEYGSSRMLTIYTLGGVAGYVVSYLAGVMFTIGASAAVCSLMGALLYYGKSRGGSYGNSVYREVSGWLISIFLFGLLFPGINNWGHGGGIAGGIILGAVLGYLERRRENNVDRAVALICGLATIAVLGWAAIRAAAYLLAPAV